MAVKKAPLPRGAVADRRLGVLQANCEKQRKKVKNDLLFGNGIFGCILTIYFKFSKEK